MLNRIARLWSDPYRVIYAARAKADRDGLYRQYRQLAERQGLDALYFVLSFDCDTREDADSVLRVHERLRDMGVSPVYAVPGEILTKGEQVYRAIAESGGEFINHGYRDHTFFDTQKGRYASCFFYDEQPLETVRADIVNGDRHLREMLGVAPRGFRAPHFGTFQKPAQLRFQHAVLEDLGYDFSTSTLPVYAYRFGPAFREFGLIELPVSGMGTMPLRILDSWSCFEAPDRRFDEKDFVREGRLSGDIFKGLGIGLLNFYADPSHIRDRPEFFDTVAYWARIARPVTYNQLLEKLN